MLGPRQVPQSVLAQVDELDAGHQRRRRRRDQDLAAVPGGHDPGGPVQRRPEVVAVAFLRPRPVATPMRTGSASSRWACTAASTAGRAVANAAQTPSPVCLNNQPPWASIAARSTSSCAARAARMTSGSVSHRRVEPSMSVNRKVTVPDGCATDGHYPRARRSHPPAVVEALAEEALRPGCSRGSLVELHALAADAATGGSPAEVDEAIAGNRRSAEELRADFPTIEVVHVSGR